jgi:hypothetical protein
MRKYTALYRAIPAALFVVGLLFMTGAQSVTPRPRETNDAPAYDQQAYTVPISNTEITLEITVDGNPPIRATQLDGGLIRIEKIGSTIYGFTPYITDRDTGEVAVRAFRIRRISTQGKVVGEGIKEIANIEASSLSNGALVVFDDSDSRFTFQVKEIQQTSIWNDGTMRKRPKRNPVYKIMCCVTCNELRTCACAVEAGCGSCCDGSCCGGGGGGDPIPFSVGRIK